MESRPSAEAGFLSQFEAVWPLFWESSNVMDSQSFVLLQSPDSWPCLACDWVPDSSGFFVMVCIFSHALSRTFCLYLQSSRCCQAPSHYLIGAFRLLHQCSSIGFIASPGRSACRELSRSSARPTRLNVGSRGGHSARTLVERAPSGSTRATVAAAAAMAGRIVNTFHLDPP